MDFRIADTFTDSLARLTGEEQKLVKTTGSNLQLLRHPGNEHSQARQGRGQTHLVGVDQRRDTDDV